LRSFEDIEVVGLGQACVDYLGRVPSFPREDGKIELLELQSQCGGPASTALVTLSRLGVKTSFLGSVSDDPIGVEVLKDLRADQVDYSFLKVTPGSPPSLPLSRSAEKAATEPFSGTEEAFLRSREKRWIFPHFREPRCCTLTG
jgi:sugar/nucleoside kinase (ribokinase family)